MSSNACDCCEAEWMCLSVVRFEDVGNLRYCVDCIEAACEPGHTNCVGFFSPMKDRPQDDPARPDRDDE